MWKLGIGKTRKIKTSYNQNGNRGDNLVEKKQFESQFNPDHTKLKITAKLEHPTEHYSVCFRI